LQGKEVSKRMNIPKETEEALIKKLNQFENSKQFTKQDMSLALLASQFETNTKYLSEIINTYKNKNFNSYINELRINYITDRLKNNKTYLQYKISYLAEESGFSSHSSFATVFKAVTGIPPTVFIELLRDQKKQSKIYAEEYEEAE
jgi:AraC-like DNA-binding protein